MPAKTVRLTAKLYSERLRKVLKIRSAEKRCKALGKLNALRNRGAR